MISLSRGVGVTLLIASLSVSSAQGQSSRASRLTPGQCLERASRATRNFPRAPDGTFRNPDSAFAASVTAANACLGQFRVDTLPMAQLGAMAQLYLVVNRDHDAVAALDRWMALAPDSAERAHVLLAGVRLFLSQEASASVTATRVAAARGYLTRLADLGPAAASAIVGANATFSSYFRLQNNDSAEVAFAQAALDAAKPITGDARQRITPMLLNVYLTLADAAANDGHPADALAMLDRASADLGDVQEVKAQLAQTKARYQLIGKPAVTLTGDYWLSSHGPVPPVTFAGKVTVLEFGAHWCGPCRASYPGLIRIAQTFQGQPTQYVLATRTYGWFGDHAALSVGEEVAYDTAYFFGEHKLPVTLVIKASSEHEDAEGRVVDELPANDRAYHVVGIPQTVVIDKQGIVRAVISGWSPANEGTITRLIRQLL